MNMTNFFQFVFPIKQNVEKEKQLKYLKKEKIQK